MAIKASMMRRIQHQSNWVADAPNSVLNLRDLQSLTSTSSPSSTLTHTRPTSLRFSSPTSEGTSHTPTTPNMPIIATSNTAQLTNKCWIKHRMNPPSPPAIPPSCRTTTKSPDSSLSRNAYPPSPRPPSPTCPVSSSPMMKTPHPSTSQMPPTKPSKTFPQYPLEPLKSSCVLTQISKKPSTPSPTDSSLPYIAAP